MRRNHPSLEHTEHRPWPMPSPGWQWRQTWADLLFLHWEIPVSAIRAKIPADLEIDTFDGTAWIGLVPFDMKGVTRWPFPAVGFLSDFPEINVRTYVTFQGKPGVWFFSLDVPNRLAVWAARRFFYLPYFHAAMRVTAEVDDVSYEAIHPERRFVARYGPSDESPLAPSPFALWSTKRYCLYTQDDDGQLYRGEIHHRQWPLQAGYVEVQEDTYLSPFPVGQRRPEILYSRSIDVAIWSLQSVS